MQPINQKYVLAAMVSAATLVMVAVVGSAPTTKGGSEVASKCNAPDFKIRTKKLFQEEGIRRAATASVVRYQVDEAGGKGSLLTALLVRTRFELALRVHQDSVRKVFCRAALAKSEAGEIVYSLPSIVNRIPIEKAGGREGALRLAACVAIEHYPLPEAAGNIEWNSLKARCDVAGARWSFLFKPPQSDAISQ